MLSGPEMKNVLIIAHLSYASPRIPGLAKYLPEFGWQPIILTAPLPEKPDMQFRVVETSYRDILSFWKKLFRFNPDEDIRRQMKKQFGVTSKNSLMDFILTRIGEIVNYPDGDRGWKPFAVTAGSELLQKEDIHAILSSSSPVTSHLIARELKFKHKIPWVADFRDLWSQLHGYSYTPIRKLFDRRLELKTLSTVDALVTVSQPWADKLSALHKGKVTYAITNGFDPAEINTPPVSLTSKFTITHTGRIYAGKQDTSKFLAALRDLVSDGTINPNEVEVRFYGTEEGWLDKEIEQYGLSGMVKQYGMMPRQVALERQRESQLLLVINWETEDGLVGCQSKLFEYLAAQRPVLATGGSGNYLTKELLDETKAGIHAPTIADVKNSLKELYQEYKFKGKINYNGDIEKINKYSHREMAKKFLEILNQVAGTADSSKMMRV